MTTRFLTPSRAAIGIVLMSISLGSFNSVSKREPEPFAAQTHATQSAPYAQKVRVNLTELAPTDKGAPDLYVRLIAIEGVLLLPVDYDR